MNEKSLFQKISVAAFLLFAIISCIATAQSLSLTLEMGIPSWLSFTIMFVFAFGLYLLTSYCFKLVIDACNMDVYVDHRRRDFILGLFGVILFWIVCSMPTNTHTFFYRNCITDVTLDDLKHTEGYLNDIRDNTFAEEKFRLQCADLESKVHAKLEDLKFEIEGPDHGDGPKAQAILVEITELLKCSPITKIDGPTNTYLSEKLSEKG